MKRVSLLVLISLALATSVFAQAPAAAKVPATRVGIIDMNRAVTENDEGSKVKDQLMAEMTKRQTQFQDEQKKADDLTKQLQAGDKTLTDAQKADMTKKIDAAQTTMTRINEDAQKDLGDLQQRLFDPIVERVKKAYNAYAEEAGLALIFDSSDQNNNIVYQNDVADITSEVIRRVNTEIAKENAGKPAAPKTAAPAPSAAAPKAATPAPSAAAPKAAAPSAAPKAATPAGK